MEYFDIYDREKKNTGRKIPRGSGFLQEGEYQLIVLAILERTDHRFLVTKRSMYKKWSPGKWEIPGGGVQAGETSLEAVCREVREETGLRLSGQEGKCVYSYETVNLQNGDNYIVDLYHFLLDFSEEDIHLQAAETVDFRILTLEEIAELNGQGDFMHFKRMQTALEYSLKECENLK